MLYRHFDKRRQLLYVGISADALKRAADHGQKPWGHLIVKITVEHFPTRAEAEAAEKAAIIAEAPRFNITHAKQRHLPIDGFTRQAPSAKTTRRSRGNCGPVELDLVKHMADIERALLERALRIYGGNRTLAGRRIGLSLRQMRNRIALFGIEVERRSPINKMHDMEPDQSLALSESSQQPMQTSPKTPRGKRPAIDLGAYIPGGR